MSLRKAAKAVVFGISWLLVLPAVVLAFAEKRLTRADYVYSTFGQLLALAPGPVGMYLRGAYYVGCLDRCSWEVHIGFGTLFVHRGASVARGVSTGSYCVIGHAEIGENVRLASRISVPSGKRQHLDDDGELSAATVFDTVRIGRDCWLGESAVIMADVGPGTIVSAGAVVTQAMPAHSIVGGNPARVLKELGASAVAQEGS